APLRRARDEPCELLPLQLGGGRRPPGCGRPPRDRGSRMSDRDDFEDFYREVILDHYKHPRNYGTIEEPHAQAEGQNPLCGDEVSIYLTFDGDDKISDVKFSGRGCAISQAATSMLTEHLKGKTA